MSLVQDSPELCPVRFPRSCCNFPFLISSFQNSNVENLPPHVIRLVYKEVSALTSDPPEGIKVFPNEEDITDVQVTIEGPGKKERCSSL